MKIKTTTMTTRNPLVRAQLLVIVLLAINTGCDESPARPRDRRDGAWDNRIGNNDGDGRSGRYEASSLDTTSSPPTDKKLSLDDKKLSLNDKKLSLDAPAGPWKLVWADEFNNSGLPDGSKWDYEEGFVRNNELQYYTKARLENAHIENGNLTIEARKDNFQGHAITSASLITKGKASWTYGRMEMRAQIPTGKGSWPAFWMLGTNIDQVGWPACGEIDIMENVGFDPDVIVGSVHLPGIFKNGWFKASAPYNGFHIYAVEWFADRLDFYYDNNKYFTYTKSGTGPFDKSHYLILNIAVGGSWGGQQGVDDSIFPLKMIIDYVRVYAYQP
jgi:beta-glucanase (GH16 family)